MSRKLHKPYRSHVSIALCTLLFILSMFSCCTDGEPIKVGYVGGLTGRRYDLGLSGRNGATLAVDRINEMGGVDGRKIKLIIKDDKQEPETEKQAVKELVDDGVVAITGHMTRSMSKETLSIINERNVVMISPATNGSYFEEKNDNFIVLYPSSGTGEKRLSKYMYHEMGLRRIAVIYGVSNRTYSESWCENFKNNFEKLNGRVVTVRTFTSGEGQSLFAIARELIAGKPDGVLVIANALDTALIRQQVLKMNKRIALTASEWAFTSDVLLHGGAAVEGVVFIEKLNLESEALRYKDFIDEYEKIFCRLPDFAAGKSYEVVLVLAEALGATTDGKRIKEAILRKRVFPGLQDEFVIDFHGDAKLGHFVVTVKNNRFKELAKL